MVPMLYKYVSVFTLHILYINRTYISAARGAWPLKFLEYLVILCFKRQYLDILKIDNNLTF